MYSPDGKFPSGKHPVRLEEYLFSFSFGCIRSGWKYSGTCISNYRAHCQWVVIYNLLNIFRQCNTFGCFKICNAECLLFIPTIWFFSYVCYHLFSLPFVFTFALLGEFMYFKMKWETVKFTCCVLEDKPFNPWFIHIFPSNCVWEALPSNHRFFPRCSQVLVWICMQCSVSRHKYGSNSPHSPLRKICIRKTSGIVNLVLKVVFVCNLLRLNCKLVKIRSRTWDSKCFKVDMNKLQLLSKASAYCFLAIWPLGSPN